MYIHFTQTVVIYDKICRNVLENNYYYKYTIIIIMLRTFHPTERMIPRLGHVLQYDC